MHHKKNQIFSSYYDLIPSYFLDFFIWFFLLILLLLYFYIYIFYFFVFFLPLFSRLRDEGARAAFASHMDADKKGSLCPPLRRRAPPYGAPPLRRRASQIIGRLFRNPKERLSRRGRKKREREKIRSAPAAPRYEDCSPRRGNSHLTRQSRATRPLQRGQVVLPAVPLLEEGRNRKAPEEGKPPPGAAKPRPPPPSKGGRSSYQLCPCPNGAG